MASADWLIGPPGAPDAAKGRPSRRYISPSAGSKVEDRHTDESGVIAKQCGVAFSDPFAGPPISQPAAGRIPDQIVLYSRTGQGSCHVFQTTGGVRPCRTILIGGYCKAVSLLDQTSIVMVADVEETLFEQQLCCDGPYLPSF
jgi:hypothetical protein